MNKKFAAKAEKIGCSALGGIITALGKSNLHGRRVAPIPKEVFSVPDKASECFTLGFGKESILPPDVDTKTYYIAGYGENNPATGVLDAPHAHAVWLDDNSGLGGLIFVSVDCVGITQSDVNKIRQAITRSVWLPKCRSINIMSTHDHAGIDTMGAWGKLPKSGKDKAYMELVTTQICKAVVTAIADRRKGLLYRGEVDVPDMQEDIRLPEVYSKTLTRFRFKPDDGTREVWIVNFASHSESLQGCNSRVSADFPGYFREKILEETGAEVFYCVGAIGGMISMFIADESEIRDAGGDFYESTRSIGRKLADYAMSIKKETPVEAKIGVLRRQFFFEVDNIVLMLAGLTKIIDSLDYSDKTASKNMAIKSELTYFEIGDTKILALPGELFPELAYGGYLTADESAEGKDPSVNPLPLCEIAGDKKTLFLGLCNDEVGYILPPNDFLLHSDAPYLERAYDRFNRKHYEEQNSLGVNTAPKIAEVFTQMIKDIRG